MILCTNINFYNKVYDSWAENNKTIGLVPTMGALHQGHLHLIECSKKENDITVVTIFVNPKQFNSPKDFENYPIIINEDIALLRKLNCDMAITPNLEEVYPPQLPSVDVDLGMLDDMLEGKYRPGHFKGVYTVLHRFFDWVKPHRVYFGKKDYQQCMVVNKLIQQYYPSIILKLCETHREQNGLAMSSRNRLLSLAQQKEAGVIFQVLSNIKKITQEQKPICFTDIIEESKQFVIANGFSKIDYLSVAYRDTLMPVRTWDQQSPIIALIAAFYNGVRLIDNMVLYE